MIYILNNQDITRTHFKHNEISYPPNWATLASQEELDSLGVITLEEVYPTLSENEYYNGTYTDDMVTLTRTYNISLANIN